MGYMRRVQRHKDIKLRVKRESGEEFFVPNMNRNFEGNNAQKVMSMRTQSRRQCATFLYEL